MFVQVIRGRVGDPAALEAALERWLKDVAPRAPGWLGTTAGVASDGTAITLKRFESGASARANAERPEQAAWWRATEPLFAGDVEVHDCASVMTMLEGGSDDAGFVQVLRGRVANPDRAAALIAQSEDVLRADRPEIVGAVIAFDDADQTRFTEAVYFTTESAARAGERKEPSPEAKRLYEAQRAIFGDLTYLDLPRPWLHSPGFA